MNKKTMKKIIKKELKKEKSNHRQIWRFISLFFGVFGVVFYRALPDYWFLLMWIPIAFGFAFYYDYFK